jgi:hypothetical protein
MNFKKVLIRLFPIFLTVIGMLAIVFGEIDDSPGLMFIGLILIVSASYMNIRGENSKVG